MRPTQRRLLKAALITIISAAVLLAAAGPILSFIISKKVRAKLEASNISIASIRINLFTRSVTIEKLELAGKVTIENVYAGGIRILPLFRDRKIIVKRIAFEGGSFTVDHDTTQHAVKIDTINITSIDVERISFDNIAVKIKRDTVTEYQAIVGLIIHHIALDSPNAFRDPAAYKFRNVEVSVKNLRIHTDDHLATFKIKYATFDKELMKLHIDSMELEPLLNKGDFARKVKSQETRTTMAVASIDATGVNMGIHMQDTSIMVSSIVINGPMIHAYKNKKYPFTRTKKFPLPMEAFQSLRIGIEVDSIKIHDGKITYEELPIEGFHTSWITFEDVEATMNSVNNREFKNLSDHSTLEASAHVMKTGVVKATFKVPVGSKTRYSAEGSITNVPLKELNPLLKDLAFIEIESGKLNRMDFVFNYDDIASHGQLHFEYENLKMLGLKKERVKDVDQMKTILLNAALKNDEALTGDIDVIRNQRKAVFNLWSISIANGIRNALLPRQKVRQDRQQDRKDKRK